MTGKLLSAEQRSELEQNSPGWPDGLRIRANLLLAYDEGLETLPAAQKAGISRGRARFWKRQFNRLGMAIFHIPEPALHEADGAGEEEMPAPAAGNLPGAEVSPVSEALALVQSTGVGLAEAAGEEKPARKKGQKGKKSPLTNFPWVTEEALPIPVKTETSGIEAQDSLAEAGRKVWLFHFVEMVSHEQATRLGEDIEGLHDMRVASRRLRTSFDVFGKAFEKKVVRVYLDGLRRIGGALGKVRDLDVLILKAETYQAELSEEARLGLGALIEAWKANRDAARDEMLDTLNSPFYQEFIHSFNCFLQTPGAGARQLPEGKPVASVLRDVVPIQVYTRLAATRAYDAILANASVIQLHALRIEFKKLRYTLEYFREILGAEAKAAVNEIKGWQDHLGDLHDAEVACQLVNDFLRQWEDNQRALPLTERLSAEPIVAYLAHLYAERHRLMVTFPDSWERFNSVEFRQGIARAVGVL